MIENPSSYEYGSDMKEGPHPYECCKSLNIGPCCCDLYGWYECTLWGDLEPPADWDPDID